MSGVDGARAFQADGESYDSFMGRYSVPLSARLADFAGVTAGQTALDVGCGPGALTRELVGRLGAAQVAACDPSPSFVAACISRNPGVEVLDGRAEALPFEANRFDHVLAQLVLHFVSEPELGVTEMSRVLRPGGRVSACVWDFSGGMEMLSLFWSAVLSLDPDAPDHERNLRFGRDGEIAALLAGAGLTDVVEDKLAVRVSYEGFEELWAPFHAGIGPAGSYTVSLPESARQRLRHRFFEVLGSPGGSFSLSAVAIAATGLKVP